jgi:hypothetical protein
VGRLPGQQRRGRHPPDERLHRGGHRHDAGPVLLGAPPLQDPPAGEPKLY